LSRAPEPYVLVQGKKRNNRDDKENILHFR
jgi:hypothetical protein